MKKYWENPEATEATIRNGWLYTADIVLMDEDSDDILLDIEVLEDLTDSVAPAHHRDYLEESQELGKYRGLKKVGAGAIYGGFLARAQDHHRVHKRIAMVGGQDDGTILRDVLQARDLSLPVGKPGTQVSVETHHTVPASIAVDARTQSLLGFFHIVGHY